MIRMTCLWFLTCLAVPQVASACSAGAPGCAPAEAVTVPQTHGPLPPRTLPGYAPGTGSAVLDQGFGRYRSENGVTMRDNGLGRIEGGGKRLRYQGTQPLRAQPRKSCRVRQSGTVICF
jgi:hypothetical protein